MPERLDDEVANERAPTGRERAEARLAVALRENLRKRRQQRTARAAASATPSNAE